jgi:hypothetical protein
MGGEEVDLVPNLGRRMEVRAPAQEGGARRGEEPVVRLGGAAPAPAAGADQRGDAPRESPAPGHLIGGDGGGELSLGKKSETEGREGGRKEGGG